MTVPLERAGADLGLCRGVVSENSYAMTGVGAPSRFLMVGGM
jgi:hypothetical protein